MPRKGVLRARKGRKPDCLSPASRTGAGRFVGTLLSHLVDANGQARTIGNPNADVASATKGSLDAYGIATLPRDLGATGFAAEDSEGLAVACAVTMNGPFGSGHTASGTGVTLANAPSQGEAGLAAAFLTPVVAVSDGAVSLVGAGAGGPNGTAGIALALLRLARGEDVIKPGALHSTGIAPYDTVNVIGCQNGVCTACPILAPMAWSVRGALSRCYSRGRNGRCHQPLRGGPLGFVTSGLRRLRGLHTRIGRLGY